jgi:hypothetical protein
MGPGSLEIMEVARRSPSSSATHTDLPTARRVIAASNPRRRTGALGAAREPCG